MKDLYIVNCIIKLTWNIGLLNMNIHPVSLITIVFTDYYNLPVEYILNLDH